VCQTGVYYPYDQNRKKGKQTYNAPSEPKDIEHGLVITDEYTRTHFQIFLALHRDIYTDQSAVNRVEGAGSDIVDIVSPSYEVKERRSAKPQPRAKAEADSV